MFIKFKLFCLFFFNAETRLDSTPHYPDIIKEVKVELEDGCQRNCLRSKVCSQSGFMNSCILFFSLNQFSPNSAAISKAFIYLVNHSAESQRWEVTKYKYFTLL